MVIRALFLYILQLIRINSIHDQFLLYLSSVGGVSKTYLITAFIFSLSIIYKEDNVLLIASTSVATSNISGATYHSTLSIFSN
jgi:PIF1-like helicase